MCLRVDKLTSAVDKLFEGISKWVCEHISHSQLDNMNVIERMKIFHEWMAQPFEG